MGHGPMVPSLSLSLKPAYTCRVVRARGTNVLDSCRVRSTCVLDLHTVDWLTMLVHALL